jgi:CheY-like chemotaxis protein
MPRNEQLAQHVFATRDARVLIVDDNPANLLVGSSLLRLYGLTVHEATSGRQALERIAHERYDLVFMDHMMPEMSGEETVRALRLQPAHASLPIVVLTANLPAETREIYQGIRIQGVLTKPLELSKLGETLLRLLPPDKILPGDAGARGAGGSAAFDARALLERVPLLDYQDGLLHCAGDEALYLALLFALAQDLAEKRTLLETALSAGDLPTAALTAHSLKSALRSVGCPSLGEQAQAMERLAKDGALAALRDQMPRFLRRMEDFRLALQAQMHRLPREAQLEFALPTLER